MSNEDDLELERRRRARERIWRGFGVGTLRVLLGPISESLFNMGRACAGAGYIKLEAIRTD